MEELFNAVFVLFMLILVLIIIVFIGNSTANRYVGLTRHTFKSKNLPHSFSGFRIVFISDLHNSDMADQIVELINQSQPDLVIFTGDMVVLPHHDLTQTLKIVSQIPKDTEICVVSGNHETEGGKYDAIINELSDNNIRVLDGKEMYLTRGDSKIRIIGLADPALPIEQIPDEQFDSMKRLVQSYTNDDTVRFNILAVHRSIFYPELKNLPVDLILAGHTHGGIIRIPFIGGLKGKKINSFAASYTKGFYNEGNASMLVSRGCDRIPGKTRFNNPPEIILLTLERDSD